jgi:hypothetical protein
MRKYLLIFAIFNTITLIGFSQSKWTVGINPLNFNRSYNTSNSLSDAQNGMSAYLLGKYARFQAEIGILNVAVNIKEDLTFVPFNTENEILKARYLSIGVNYFFVDKKKIRVGVSYSPSFGIYKIEKNPSDIFEEGGIIHSFSVPAYIRLTRITFRDASAPFGKSGIYLRLSYEFSPNIWSVGDINNAGNIISLGLSFEFGNEW